MDPLGQLVDRVVPALIARAPLTPEKIKFAWRTAVGPAIDRATEVRLVEHTLVIHGDARWLAEIDRSRDLILRRLTRLLGPGVVGALGRTS
jgi:hypothetical protein